MPSSNAIGIVIASVNVAHGEDFSAFTITSATTPSKITMIASTASCAMNPPRRLTSSRAISPSDLPSRRIEQNKIMKVLHASGQHRARNQPHRAGQDSQTAPRASARPAAQVPRSRQSDGRTTPTCSSAQNRVRRRAVRQVSRANRRARAVSPRQTPSTAGTRRDRRTHAASTNQIALSDSPRASAIFASAHAPKSDNAITSTSNFFMSEAVKNLATTLWRRAKSSQPCGFPAQIGSPIRPSATDISYPPPTKSAPTDRAHLLRQTAKYSIP